MRFQQRYRFIAALLACWGGGASCAYSQTDVLSDMPGVSGGQVSGGNVTAEISTGSGIAGGVGFDVPMEVQAIDGFIGQLYDPVVVDIAASPDTVVDEGDTRQLSATATMDDGTLLELDAVDLTWAVVSGPVSGITADGIATAETPIFADGPATVRGTFDGVGGDCTPSYPGRCAVTEWRG